eukprot:TRINITY_DN5413_c0_g1_i11.p1 TRINITY_DN5413_c0_g1~~TRINITY_DN5413_c0_g1_i11.p1  ORF type:complete len:524 (-),score=78.94 TRINITY_DN5413_c0_g1_i11:324-1895(-)
MMLRLFAAIPAVAALEPGRDGFFEDFVREQVRAPAASPLDLRVSKAIGHSGYNHVRVSVVSQKTPVDLSHLNYTSLYNNSFQFRWQAAYDLGRANVSCKKGGVYRTKAVTCDSECLNLCTEDARCKFYTWFPNKTLCALADSCAEQTADDDAEATYAKAGSNVLSSAVVPLVTGQNVLQIAGQSISVNLPAAGSGIRGVVIADPCVSGRWIGCYFAEKWQVFNRTHRMMNAMASKKDLDFFGVLGDNFYDKDGRLTRGIWDQLSLDFKSHYLLTMPGNHDVWVHGSPHHGDKYDQYAWGFSQFYAQDTVASLTASNGFMHFESGGPDVMQDWKAMNNDVRNSFFYHMLGNLGFIGYNGAATTAQLDPLLRQACQYFGASQPDAVFLLGHWDAKTYGCQTGSDTPDVRTRLLSMDGCSHLGDKLKFMDGHTHCNHPQVHGNTTEVGFMIGGHGMKGCNQYGFAVIDSTGGDLKVLYFEERSEAKDDFEEILSCVTQSGISGCYHLATAVWLGGSVSKAEVMTVV